MIENEKVKKAEEGLEYLSGDEAERRNWKNNKFYWIDFSKHNSCRIEPTNS